jgi:competence protein ComEA
VLLERLDQAAVAVILVLSLGCIAIGLLIQGCRHGGLIEIDAAPPQPLHFRVDVNSAAWPELSLLPAIGPTLAQRIVQSRLQDGPFRDHDDLLRVKGLGPKTLEGIRPYLLPIPEFPREETSPRAKTEPVPLSKSGGRSDHSSAHAGPGCVSRSISHSAASCS